MWVQQQLSQKELTRWTVSVRSMRIFLVTTRKEGVLSLSLSLSFFLNLDVQNAWVGSKNKEISSVNENDWGTSVRLIYVDSRFLLVVEAEDILQLCSGVVGSLWQKRISSKAEEVQEEGHSHHTTVIDIKYLVCPNGRYQRFLLSYTPLL